ncbi:MAG: nitric oxide synthase [Spirochaetales bacterium]|jgi:flavodoxin|nr:nitric oxide synthase [Spirochaetales bacterium]
MKAAIIYWSKSGNTEKVAKAIEACMQPSDIDVELVSVDSAENLDFFDFDLVCLGFPIYSFRPAEVMDRYLLDSFRRYYKQGRVVFGAPKVPGKNAVIFATFAGAHTGMTEPAPATKYVALIFEHLGFTVLDEIHIVGEFHGKLDYSTKGKLGDIRGRPNETDLAEVGEAVQRAIQTLT